MSLKISSIAAVVASIGVAAFHNDAQAYLNPGSGSIILQAIIAGFAVISVTVKIYWYRLKAFIKGETYDPNEDLLADLDLDDKDEDEEKPAG